MEMTAFSINDGTFKCSFDAILLSTKKFLRNQDSKYKTKQIHS
jgi:hypothetical protein